VYVKIHAKIIIFPGIIEGGGDYATYTSPHQAPKSSSLIGLKIISKIKKLLSVKTIVESACQISK